MFAVEVVSLVVGRSTDAPMMIVMRLYGMDLT